MTPEPSTIHPVRTVLFDLGNVLVFFCHERMCRQIGEVCGRSALEVRQALLESAFQAEFERGMVGEVEFHQRLENLFATEFAFDHLRRAAADIFELNHAMLPILDSLKQQRYRLVLLSNTCVSHYEWIRDRFEVLNRFDALVLSFETGAIKPEDKIYSRALQAIDCAPEECLYFDDIPAYVDAGRRFGLQAEVFVDAPGCIAELRRRDAFV